ncbi:MAG: hypothetical protein FJ387_06380 [Verrucomicrobia bacterium]|nr:hypothetical protein [Verrucomicrobiota bacterium]
MAFGKRAGTEAFGSGTIRIPARPPGPSPNPGPGPGPAPGPGPNPSPGRGPSPRPRAGGAAGAESAPGCGCGSVAVAGGWTAGGRRSVANERRKPGGPSPGGWRDGLGRSLRRARTADGRVMGSPANWVPSARNRDN